MIEKEDCGHLLINIPFLLFAGAKVRMDFQAENAEKDRQLIGLVGCTIPSMRKRCSFNSVSTLMKKLKTYIYLLGQPLTHFETFFMLNCAKLSLHCVRLQEQYDLERLLVTTRCISMRNRPSSTYLATKKSSHLPEK